MFDPAKMSGEEWHVEIVGAGFMIFAGNVPIGLYNANEADCMESVLLHNERLIMERRKPLRWFIFPWNDGWVVCHGNGHKLTRDDGTYFTGPYPCGLLAEADAYFKEMGK